MAALVELRDWRATVDAFRTFLANGAPADQLSNLVITASTQQLRGTPPIPDPDHPSNRDASRTKPPQQKSQPPRRPLDGKGR